jgi:glutathione peroxidase
MTVRQTLLKWIYPLLVRRGKHNKALVNTMQANPIFYFYDLQATLTDTTVFNFAALKGKKVLLVNTASDCGYTRQYEELQKLYELYRDQVVIIGFPSNDFAEQEKGSDEEIAQFCKLNYGVTFMLARKSVVIKTAEQNAVFRWLTSKEKNGWNDGPPQWNFTKYLVNEDGVLTHVFPAAVQPTGTEVQEALKSKNV